jgi:hypothetical protein
MTCAGLILVELLRVKKILVVLAVVFLGVLQLPVQAGVRFGIPLPFPFLVWTPSHHCGQGHHGACTPKGQDEKAVVSKPQNSQ